eukprot:79386_1
MINTFWTLLLLSFETWIHHIHGSLPPYVLDWTSSASPPYGLTKASVGYSAQNDTIYILGPKDSTQGGSLVALNPTTKILTTDLFHNKNLRQQSMLCCSIELHLYDQRQVIATSIRYEHCHHVIHDFEQWSACIAGATVLSHDYLFLLGQGEWYDIYPYESSRVQLFNLSSTTWITTNVPNMIQKRSYFGCIAHDYQSTPKVFAIGGNGVDDIEVLDAVELLNNITIGSSATSWANIAALTMNSMGERATNYLHDIIIFGFDTFNVLNTITNAITYIGASWTPLYYGAPILAHLIQPNSLVLNPLHRLRHPIRRRDQPPIQPQKQPIQALNLLYHQVQRHWMRQVLHLPVSPLYRTHMIHTLMWSMVYDTFHIPRCMHYKVMQWM